MAVVIDSWRNTHLSSAVWLAGLSGLPNFGSGRLAPPACVFMATMPIPFFAASSIVFSSSASPAMV